LFKDFYATFNYDKEIDTRLLARMALLHTEGSSSVRMRDVLRHAVGDGIAIEMEAHRVLDGMQILED
jgi:hypothetical protein